MSAPGVESDPLRALADVWAPTPVFLVGGGALRAHGLLDRLTDDLDVAIPVALDLLLERMADLGWRKSPAPQR